MRSIAKVLPVVLILSLFFALPLLAWGQNAVPDPADPGAFIGAVLGAIRGGDYQVVAALGLVAVVYVLRKWVFGWVAWFKTDEGGAVFLTVIGFALGLSAALFAHQPITWALLGKILIGTVGAGGLWGTTRKLLRAFGPLLGKIPTVGPLLARLAAWLSGADVAGKVATAADGSYKPLPSPSGADVAAGLDQSQRR